MDHGDDYWGLYHLVVIVTSGSDRSTKCDRELHKNCPTQSIRKLAFSKG